MLTAEDVSEQIDQLQEIAYLVQNSVYYRPAFIGRNPYYEIEMLNDFKKFSGYSALVTEYFLHYEGEETIFCHAKKSYLSSYVSGRFDLENTDKLAAFLNSCETPSFYPMPSGTLAVFPIHMGTAFGYTGRACMCFYLADEALLARAQFKAVRGDLLRHFVLQMVHGYADEKSLERMRAAGHRIVIITARSTAFYMDPYKTTEEELRRGGIAYDKLICTQEKASACLEEQIDVLIDDHPRNCETVAAVGVEVINMLSWAHRDTQMPYPRVANWKEAVEAIIRLQQTKD